MPVNTGLNFNEDEIKFYSDQRLALFYKNGMNWDTKLSIVDFIHKVSHIRIQYPWIFNNKDITILATDNRKVLGFEIGNNKNKAIVLFNTNYHKQEWFEASNLQHHNFLDLFHEKKIVFKNNIALSKGAFLLLKVL
jgi:glycosidase